MCGDQRGGRRGQQVVGGADEEQNQAPRPRQDLVGADRGANWAMRAAAQVSARSEVVEQEGSGHAAHCRSAFGRGHRNRRVMEWLPCWQRPSGRDGGSREVHARMGLWGSSFASNVGIEPPSPRCNEAHRARAWRFREFRADFAAVQGDRVGDAHEADHRVMRHQRQPCAVLQQEFEPSLQQEHGVAHLCRASRCSSPAIPWIASASGLRCASNATKWPRRARAHVPGAFSQRRNTRTFWFMPWPWNGSSHAGSPISTARP